MVVIKIFRNDALASLPSRAHPDDTPPDAGFDLASTVTVDLAPGEIARIPTGVHLAVPSGFAAFIYPRSGLAVDHGITVLDSPSVIDPNYRGEIEVILINHHRNESYRVSSGERIAQMLIHSVEQEVTFQEVARRSDLPATERGHKGLGSSGKH